MKPITRGVWSVQELQSGLSGSPYSVPHGTEELHRASSLLDTILDISVQASVARQHLDNVRFKLIKGNQRVKEIHESNRVEGLGPTLLGQTNEILSGPVARDTTSAINLYSVLRTLESDNRTLDVLGLHGAKLFAEQLVGVFPGEPLTEVDVRSMHGLLMQGHPGAGRYKQYLNSIAGSRHSPLAPSDTPGAMAHLVDWLNRTIQSRCLPPVVIAAAVHAWLAHIHPFDDGNGRISRVLANLIVGGSMLPPIIINLSDDRDQYIDALAISDEGGNLAPLIGVFNRVMLRAVTDMRDPDFALRLFNDEVRQRSLGEYVLWRRTAIDWFKTLGGALLLHDLRLRFDDTRMISQESFERLKSSRTTEGIVSGGIGNNDRYPDSRAYLLFDKTRELFRYSNGEPAISFLRYAPRAWGDNVYRLMDATVSEVIIKADPAEGVFIRNRSGRASRLPAVEAAQLVAQSLAEDFRRGAARASY
ncbi:Fic family protein [Catellatospora chokoriensis]|uniref:Fido domain-containing protein n=1 Tax=Catellatospora chokoriensis TaxID=310353 RepID=A0A8J3K1S9_9ACTN|nr:Fic family protein [Catellatospora chokoriensis]GIF89145.1 hypothetical protein Cch02nite_25890 [Catellatospora chokoriensis]